MCCLHIRFSSVLSSHKIFFSSLKYFQIFHFMATLYDTLSEPCLILITAQCQVSTLKLYSYQPPCIFTKNKASPTSKIRKPTPSQHSLQVLSQLHHAVISASASYFSPLRGTQLIPPSQDGAVDNGTARRSGFDTDYARHATSALGRAVCSGVEAAVGDEGRKKLICDGEEPPVCRFGKRRQSG
jgi:hypothetical protein